MKEALKNIKHIFPAERLQSNVAIFLSIMAVAFAVGSSNVPCLNADTCSVGSDEVFSGTLTIQNNTNYGVKLTGNPTANRTITFPDADGTVKLAGATLTADKMLVSDTNGEVAVTDKYPFTLGTAGQFLKVSSSGLTMDFLTVGGLDSLTANAPYLSVDSLGVIDSSATLTASTPLKSSASGQITASDLNPTTDIAVGSATAGQILQVGTSSALEWANPSGGGSVSLTAKGSITGGRVVASVIDSNELKVEDITSFQSSVNDTDYSSTDSFSSDSRYNHYNAIADKYIQCFRGQSSTYLDCKTGDLNTATNEITWGSPVTVSSYFPYINISILPFACAYADDVAHNYYVCLMNTSSSNDNYIHYVSFYIDPTSNQPVQGSPGSGNRLCWGNYAYTNGSCGTAVPVWDMQTNTWVFVSAVNGDASTMGTSSTWAIVISKNFVPNNNSTCNGAGSGGVNCGFPSAYDNKLKVNGPYNNTNYFDTSVWQLALDQRNSGYNRLHAVALDNGNSNDYEYAIIGKADSSGSGGSMQDGGWSAVHLERTSVGGNYSVGTPIANFNNKSVNTGTVNQFCGGNTNNEDSLHDNVYGQGTTDVGFYFLYTCTEATSYGGSGQYKIYGNFFSPNPATNTLDMANAESISLYEPTSGIFGGNVGSSNLYLTKFKSMFSGSTILIGGANYMAEPDGTYLGCNGTVYCAGVMVTEWNATKTAFNPLSFSAYRINDYTYASPIHNTDENIFTFYFTNVSSGNSMGYITPTIDKNRGNWIGFVNASANDGDTVTVNIISGKATGLTGLVAGTTYFVGGDGTLSTSGTSGNKFCKAISSTECLITQIN